MAPPGSFLPVPGTRGSYDPFLDSSLDPSQTATPKSLVEKQTRKRTCDAFYYMPDKDPKTKYFNPRTRKLK
jgi:hypothetical protein